MEQLKRIDLAAFQKETALYQPLESYIDCIEDEKSLNLFLKKNMVELGISIPWEGDFDTFMRDKSQHLIYEWAIDMFKCDRCGACCRHLDLSKLYAELDRGDGTCKYLSGNLCSIYEKRPLLCRVDESYQKFFKEVMSIDTYYRINREACQKLKSLEK